MFTTHKTSMSLMMLFSLIFTLTCTLKAQTIRNQPKIVNSEIILFDANNPDLCHYREYHRKNKPGMTVATKIVTGKQNKKELNCVIDGKIGSHGTIIVLTNSEALFKNYNIDGLKIYMNTESNEFHKVKCAIGFNDKTSTTANIMLNKNESVYIVKGGYRRAKFPPKWGKIANIRFYVQGKGEHLKLDFNLSKITMITKPKSNTKNGGEAKTLHIAKIRKTHEVIFTEKKINIDGKMDDDEWGDLTELKGFSYWENGKIAPDNKSPFKVKMCYDNKYLYVATESDFPTKPLARTTKHDGTVWNDEALEIFLSTENDNEKFIQFVINHKGVVFDARRMFDIVSDGVINNIRWQFKDYLKGFTYSSGTWISEFAFPLNELGFNIKKMNFMGFQICQDYRYRDDSRLQTLSWSKTKKFTDTYNFGTIFLNNKPFGSGVIDVAGIECVTLSDTQAAFTFNCVFDDFKPGRYKIKKTIVAPDFTITEKEEALTISSTEKFSKNYKMTPVKDKSGKYTIYISVINKENNSKLYAGDFNNSVNIKSKFGKRLFSPIPKKLVWGKGTFMARKALDLFLDNKASAKTQRTAKVFTKDYYGYTGIQLKTEQTASLKGKKGVILKIADKAQFKGQSVKLQKEGYHLLVTKDSVQITAFDEPGLYYGTVTFFQLLKNGMKTEKGLPVPCIEILDWSDLDKRICALWPTHQINKNRKFKDKITLDYLLSWVDRHVAGNKMNMFLFNLGAHVKYKRRPEFNDPSRPFSLDDLKKLKQFCDARFIEIIPAWNIGSHSIHWLLGQHPELREKGWIQQADVLHPEHDNIVYDCMLDVIEVLKPKYLSPFNDEWWHKHKKGETPDKLLHGKDRGKVFIEWNLKLHKWLKKQGIQLVSYYDMFTPYHNGTRYDLYKETKKLPKDIIMMVWSPNRRAEFFLDMGFEVWSVGNVFMPYQNVKDRLGGVGVLRYSFGACEFAYYKKGPFERRRVLEQIRTADYAWNMKTDLAETVNDQIDSGRMETLSFNYAVDKNPHAGIKITPLILKEQYNNSFSKFIKSKTLAEYKDISNPVEIQQGVKDIGYIPMDLHSNSSKNCIVLEKNSLPVTIPVNKTFSSLIFLHTAYMDKKIKPRMDRGRPFGPPSGNYIVHYADGSEEKLIIRIGLNIKHFNTKSLFRFTNQNRFIYSLKDKNNKDLYLYQWEWINPHPLKKITAISFIHDNEIDLSVILFALSGREVVSNPE
jgi:Glycosyl hydrolase family 20, domain 2/Carbohydrate family 9 binding domain-like